MSRGNFLALYCLCGFVLWAGCSDVDKGVDPETSGDAPGDTGPAPRDEVPADGDPPAASEPPNGETPDPSAIGSTDPPYATQVTFPSGLRLDGLVRDAGLTSAYPAPDSNPFGSGRDTHYARVENFIEIAQLSNAQRQGQVAKNFKLEEYVRIPERNNDGRIYIDAQIALHGQELRDAWGGPLVLSSTYRSPEYNNSIGGATFSRHMYGDAVDIRGDNTSMAMDLYNLARVLEVDFIDSPDNTIQGKNNPWIHLDDRGWRIR